LGTASIVLSIIGISISWIPYVGWGAVVLGVLGLAASIPSITYWHHKPGYTGWGISGLFLGCWSFSLGFAYQTKYADGALDYLVHPFTVTPLIAANIALGLVTAFGLYLARVKHRKIGIVLSALAMLAVSVFSGWTLVTADHAFERAHSGDTIQQIP
jgi:hypothetical protein